jgi:hypothetical protein
MAAEYGIHQHPRLLVLPKPLGKVRPLVAHQRVVLQSAAPRYDAIRRRVLQQRQVDLPVPRVGTDRA